MITLIRRLASVLMVVAATSHAQVVESPTTVSRGEWLVEADVVAGTWDSGRPNGIKLSTWEVVTAPVLVSTGVAENIDVQLGFDGWVHAEAQAQGQQERVSGWGDAWLRAKWNFFGNEETGPAWALLPYVKFPVADDRIGNGKFEGGVALIFGQPLDEDDWIQAFVSGDTLHSEIGGRDEQLVAGIVWGRNLSADTTVYTEILTEWLSAETDSLPVVWGTGISPVIADGFALDFEILVGITDEAPDRGAAVRLVWEF